MVRFVDSEGESDVATGDGLAPVTPLFAGGRGSGAPETSYPKTAAEVRRSLDELLPAGRRDAPASGSAAADWRTEWDDDPVSGDPITETAAPPIDLTAERADRARGERRTRPGESAESRGVRYAGATESSVGRSHQTGASRGSRSGERSVSDADPATTAEAGLLKKLRARQLSVSEAKAYLGQHDLDGGSVDGILDAFVERGYLDDARLAEQVVHAGVDRKGQGRQVIAQSLAKRGVPREVADAALAELPDDDAERALEFARSKANSLRGLERDVALRRLAGQLARRGYGGSLALNAARTALDETARPPGRVRFEER